MTTTARNQLKSLIEAARSSDAWTAGYARESLKVLASDSGDWKVRMQARLALARLGG